MLLLFQEGFTPCTCILKFKHDGVLMIESIWNVRIAFSSEILQADHLKIPHKVFQIIIQQINEKTKTKQGISIARCAESGIPLFLILSMHHVIFVLNVGSIFTCNFQDKVYYLTQSVHEKKNNDLFLDSFILRLIF